MLAFNHLGQLGRLGNQMFQYAAVRGIAANKGYQWCIPNHKEFIFDSLGNKLRIELFDCFNLCNLTNENIFILDQGYAPIVQEKFFHFDEELYNLCPNDVSLFGYFQSERWFKNIEEQIRSDFTFRDEISSPCRDMIDGVEAPIGLHIRRGDYLKNSQNHYNLGLDYYETALGKFDVDRNVIIFSDDPDWCKEQKLFSSDRFMVSESTSPYIDMCLMSLCSDFIIANSTFSWWAAWLSDHKNKKVVAPLNWFGPNLLNNEIKDLYCKDWIVV